MKPGRSVLGAIALQAIFLMPASAEVAYTGSCVGNVFFGSSSNCVFMKRSGPFGYARVIKVDEPRGEELEAALERDRKWVARCKPVIRQDSHGVGKYYYAASGCEFGKTDDY